MATGLIRGSRGFSLIECLIATAILATGLLALCALFVAGTEQIEVARHRSQGTLLARARLDRLIADVDAGAAPSSGEEHLDAAGRPLRSPGPYQCYWSVTVAPSGSGRLLRLSVTVRTRAAAAMRAPDVRLTTLRRSTQP